MPKTIEQYYDFLSSVYDQKTPEFARLPCKKAVEIIQRNEITNVGKLLDLWCGTGQVLDELITANISNDGYVWIDISSKMIEIIKTKYPDIKTSKIDIEEKFDTVKWKFDTIIMIWLFEFLTKKDYVLNHICDKLKKWWYFLFSFEEFVDWHSIQRDKHSPMGKVWNAPIHPLTDFDNFRYTVDEIKDVLKDKFEVIDQEKFIWYYKTQDRIAIYYTNILCKKI